MGTATPTHPTQQPPRAATAIMWLNAILAMGSLLLAVGHLGVSVPLLSALGPGGNDAVLPAAAAFAVSAALSAAVAVGASRRRPWTWPLGLVVAAVTIAGAAVPFRGPVSLVGILLGIAIGGVLVSTPGRRAFVP